MSSKTICQECGSDRVFDAYAHGKDSCSAGYMGREKDGYLPYIDNVCGGDDLEVSICLECGQAQGAWPVAGPEEWDTCPECELALPEDLDPDKEYVCECGYIVIKGPPREDEPREHGGACGTVVPTQKCRLMVPIKVCGLKVGHEFYVEGNRLGFLYVRIDGNLVGLNEGSEAELI